MIAAALGALFMLSSSIGGVSHQAGLNFPVSEVCADATKGRGFHSALPETEEGFPNVGVFKNVAITHDAPNDDHFFPVKNFLDLMLLVRSQETHAAVCVKFDMWWVVQSVGHRWGEGESLVAHLPNCPGLLTFRFSDFGVYEVLHIMGRRLAMVFDLYRDFDFGRVEDDFPLSDSDVRPQLPFGSFARVGQLIVPGDPKPISGPPQGVSKNCNEYSRNCIDGIMEGVEKANVFDQERANVERSREELKRSAGLNIAAGLFVVAWLALLVCLLTSVYGERNQKHPFSKKNQYKKNIK